MNLYFGRRHWGDLKELARESWDEIELNTRKVKKANLIAKLAKLPPTASAKAVKNAKGLLSALKKSPAKAVPVLGWGLLGYELWDLDQAKKANKLVLKQEVRDLRDTYYEQGFPLLLEYDVVDDVLDRANIVEDNAARKEV